MKFTLGLVAILAIIGLGQAHQFPDFGKGPLHEDLQDILDLIPVDKIVEVAVDYLLHDKELEKFLDELGKANVFKDLLVDFEAIPEVINLFDYLHKEGLNVYQIINEINKVFRIKELIPPNSPYSLEEKRTGGVRGFLVDLKKQFDSDAFISIYVDKLKVSTAFVNFINQLKSDNFQQIVNKVCKIKAFQFIVSSLKDKSVNLKIVGDVLYLLFGITVPYPSPTILEELMDFWKLIPMEKYLDIIIKYVNEDEKVKNAILFMFESEFHDLLRALEAIKEFQAFVIFMEKTGLPMIQGLQELHHAIGMEKYVPPKIENFVRSLIKTQKIGDGMQGMLKDLYDILPLDKIDALYAKKMRNSKVFVDFMTKIMSKEAGKIVNDLIAHKTYKEFITKTKEQGLDIEGSQILSNRILGIKSSKI